MKQWFSKNQPLIIPGVLVLVTITLSFGVTVIAPSQMNAPAQFLIDVVLFLFSAWLGIAYNTEQAKKHGVDSWIPAAEAASRELLTIKANIELMQNQQGKICQNLPSIFAELSSEQLSPIQALLHSHCESCTDNLTIINNQVANNFNDWDAFIETNCEEKICTGIHNRLDEFRKELGLLTKQTIIADRE